MIKLFFGLPGCGKTTLMCSFALKFSNLKRYKHIYTNTHMTVKNVTYIDNEDIGFYDLSDSLILIDEATLFADNRDYKNFKKEVIQFFLEHRHYNCDIFLFTQQWDGVDRKIRVITDRVYYVFKRPIIGKLITNYYKIPYGIIIPKKNDTKSSNLGEIVQGYCQPSIINKIFCFTIFRPYYYKYFDSWEKPYLPPLSEKNNVTNKSITVNIPFQPTVETR